MEFENILTIPTCDLKPAQLKDMELLHGLNKLNLNVFSLIKIRLKQTKFREKLINYFGTTCIISGTNNLILDECEAAHIIPVAANGSYEVSNGLLLSRNLHKTFDLFKWSINPKTLKIESVKDAGSINLYPKDCLINKLNNSFIPSLTYHYNEYIKLNK
jgi:predicted restriction endonuclease